MHRRTRVRRRRLLAAAAAVTIGGLVSGQVANAVGLHASDADAARTYVVRPGDTLWAIAHRFEPGTDPRPLVDAIATTNGLDAGSLVPGQELLIPAAS